MLGLSWQIQLPIAYYYNLQRILKEENKENMQPELFNIR